MIMNNINVFLVTSLVTLFSGVLGIKITKILVPKFVNVGDYPKLMCEFDLEGEQLDYVKWYKDGEEFVKVGPTKILGYQERKGISLDVPESNRTTIVMKDVSIFSSGLYKCKVASDKKEVKETAVRVMLVVERPNKVELITTKDVYEIGEKLEAKCVSYSSNPVAFISWNINGEDISFPQHESGKTDAAILNEYLIGIQAHQSDSKGSKSDEFLRGKNSSLQLSFNVQEKSLKTGLKLQCRAYVGGIYVPATRKIKVIQPTNSGILLNGQIFFMTIFVMISFILK